MNRKKKILIICQDHVGKAMAGPAIRSWEFSNSLSKKYAVTLLAPNDPDIKSSKFRIKKITRKTLRNEMMNSDVVISQKITPEIARYSKKYKVRTILDSYDPISIESLEANSSESMQVRQAINKILLLEQSFSFIYADGVICASEKQRDYWIGVLSSLNRIDPAAYDNDNSLRKIIDVVPFGLSSQSVGLKNNKLRKKFGFKDDDFVLLWGGGIWNWFDPLTLIEAVANISKSLNVKLVFMGIDHPNKDIPRMQMVERAFKKSAKLGLTNKSVFFNEGWVPYDKRNEFLLGADAGVSMHYDHLETRFSFRTRMLDYIWAGLPIIATKGDSFAELIDEKQLGVVVGYQDKKGIIEGIEKLIKDKSYISQAKQNLAKVKSNFYWDRCTKPIIDMVEAWEKEPWSKKPSISYSMNIFMSFYKASGIITKKVIKKYLSLSANKHRLVNLYTSQNVIRRKTFKNLIGKK